MLNWLSHLFRRRTVAFPGLPASGQPERSFPTADTISEWDDQGLYEAASYEAVIRYHNDGFEALNDAERFLCCFYLLESHINNGGAGHWVELLCPLSAMQTTLALQEIGATEMSDFTEYVLRPLGVLTKIRSREAWMDQYQSMPDDVHEHWDTLTPQYCNLEDRFLELAYAYARVNWNRVRAT